jgi:hypothetical protein
LQTESKGMPLRGGVARVEQRVVGGSGWGGRSAWSSEDGEEPLDLVGLGDDGANGEASTAMTTDAKVDLEGSP